MNTSFKLKNFRIFDNVGASLEDIAPITFLTGSNSSGKSSAVKGIFLLESFLAQIKKAVEDKKSINLAEFKLDFSSFPNNTLGRFGKVLNRDSKPQNNLITFEYTKRSSYLSKDINVVLSFSGNEHDDLDNGYLHSLEMYIDDELFYRCSRDDNHRICNLNIIKEYCADFVTTEFAAYLYLYTNNEYEFGNKITPEEYASQLDKLKVILLRNGENHAQDVSKHIRCSELGSTLDFRDKEILDKMDALEQTKQEHSFFIIPVVQDLLASASVDEFKKVCLSILEDNIQESDNPLLDKINNDFVLSGTANFNDYFKNKVLDFLSDAIKTNPPLNIYDETKFEIPSFWDFIPEQLNSFVGTNVVRTFRLENGGRCLTKDERDAQKEKNLQKLNFEPLSFGLLYKFIMDLNNIYITRNGIKANFIINEFPNTRYIHYSYEILTRFACNVITDSLLPSWVGSLSYVGSTRADVRRLYSLVDKNSFSSLLKRYYDGKRRVLENKSQIVNQYYPIDSFINKWIEQFGLGKSISFSFDEEGVGIQIRLKKDNQDDGHLLADEGYGITQLVSVLLEIETTILNSMPSTKNNYYGMYEFPMDENESQFKAKTIVLEEPEIHLHPKYQSLIAEMLEDAYNRFNIHFIIETHSEYLLRRTQYMVACSRYISQDELNKKCPFKVFYFPEKGSVYDMQYRTNGKFTQSFGEGFFDESDNWAIKMYDLEED